MIQTRLYRVLGIAVNIAGAIVVGINQWGPGIGLTAGAIGLIIVGANGIIFIGRQILDPTTPTLPQTPVPLPPPQAGTPSTVTSVSTNLKTTVTDNPAPVPPPTP